MFIRNKYIKNHLIADNVNTFTNSKSVKFTQGYIK